MKITRVEPILIRTPLKLDDARPSSGGVPKNDIYTLLVRVDTDEGVSGKLIRAMARLHCLRSPDSAGIPTWRSSSACESLSGLDATLG